MKLSKALEHNPYFSKFGETGHSWYWCVALVEKNNFSSCTILIQRMDLHRSKSSTFKPLIYLALKVPHVTFSVVQFPTNHISPYVMFDILLWDLIYSILCVPRLKSNRRILVAGYLIASQHVKIWLSKFNENWLANSIFQDESNSEVHLFIRVI